jgi:hypothetical protein
MTFPSHFKDWPKGVKPDLDGDAAAAKHGRAIEWREVLAMDPNLPVEDLRTMPADVKSAVGQYVECGGALFVLGKDPSLPGPWKAAGKQGERFAIATPAAVICEILKDNGEMARLDRQVLGNHANFPRGNLHHDNLVAGQRHDRATIGRKHRVRLLRVIGAAGNGPHFEIGQRSKVEPPIGEVHDVRARGRHRDRSPERRQLLAVRNRYRKSRHGSGNRGTEPPHGADGEREQFGTLQSNASVAQIAAAARESGGGRRVVQVHVVLVREQELHRAERILLARRLADLQLAGAKLLSDPWSWKGPPLTPG